MTQKDTKTIKLLQSIEKIKGQPNCAGKELSEEIAYELSKDLYEQTKNDLGLLSLGFTNKEIKEKIKRNGGRPKASLLSNENIVQLVAKQQYQEGKKFRWSEEEVDCDGRKFLINEELEKSPSFLAVAENNGISVHTVIKQYKKVDHKKRADIFKMVKRILTKHGLLHARFIDD